MVKDIETSTEKVFHHTVLRKNTKKIRKCKLNGLVDYQNIFIFYFVCFGRVPDPTSHFPPDLILYVNLVAMGTPKRFKTWVPKH
jgi:hypothetical protein